ncbi:L,D-transpeptidase family protein [Mucilaginibacter aquariorum]|uniref:L,D-transpeptidase family protein n=1 Tax=Mucilaginibacter aquariorum TaxID=2967225 RepID=A0ABT1T4I2_9SPHI|nr:L,D-transpeptidase family protein [Mucilaginibacter aquariorum]MCQ6959181.1 L,D-transpeptidase family protein [Mucilaginibacter aquariorum]
MKKYPDLKDCALKRIPAGVRSFICLLIILSIITASPANSKASNGRELSEEIEKQLNSGHLWLTFPASTKKFYQQRKFDANWITTDTEAKQTWQAMLMLDCVLQFGLSYEDYHYNDHLPSMLHDILEAPDKVSLSRQARFEIMLTDDMITFINQLHYGVLNPQFSSANIDTASAAVVRAEAVLKNAMKEDKFMRAIADVQPRSKEYESLQEYLSSAVQYLDNCYELPRGELRHVAMNMERLRWAGITDKNFLMVNIPSYVLKYYHQDSIYRFKVIVGTPKDPTPSLQSELKYFITAPDRKLPARIFIEDVVPNAIRDHAYLENNHYTIYDRQGRYVNPDHDKLMEIKQKPSVYFARQSSGCDNAFGAVVFRFPNVYAISIHDTPEKQLFEKEERAFSQSSIRVEQPAQLAALLLEHDHAKGSVAAMQKAIAAYKNKRFNLNRAVPVKVVYLTCESEGGKLTTYKDIYNLDKSLELAMFDLERPLSKM